MVEVQKVRKNFGRLEVPKDIDTKVLRGTVTCLIGPSGSGKSTLLCCINHLEKVDASRLYVDDFLIDYREKNGSLYEVSAAEATRQCRGIGIVFQDFNLLPHRMVLGNITEAPVPVEGVSQEQAEKHTIGLLETIGLAHRAGAYPVQLSDGRQQHVAITRVLAMGPKLMLFNEPTSALGLKLVGEVLSVIRGLADKGMAMIVVAHEMGFAREVAGQVVFMTDGMVVEKGTPDEVLGDPKHERTCSFLFSLLK